MQDPAALPAPRRLSASEANPFEGPYPRSPLESASVRLVAVIGAVALCAFIVLVLAPTP